MQVEELEDFVARYSGKVLHPNHVLVVDKVYNLAKMYGRMEGYGADVLTDEQLKTKRDLCERALKVLNVIMPGKSYHTYFGYSRVSNKSTTGNKSIAVPNSDCSTNLVA